MPLSHFRSLQALGKSHRIQRDLSAGWVIGSAEGDRGANSVAASESEDFQEMFSKATWTLRLEFLMGEGLGARRGLDIGGERR